MGVPRIAHCGVFAFMLMAHAGLVSAQSTPDLPAHAQLSSTMIASVEQSSAWCVGVHRVWIHSGDARDNGATAEIEITEERGDGMLVAEDMRCRQCHGKCTTDSLRCRSQCLNDSACLEHCEERSSKCTAMCKQVFQCQ
jgi:hypothetical protein